MSEDVTKNKNHTAHTVRDLDHATFARENLEGQSHTLMSDLSRKMDQMRRLHAEIERLSSESNVMQIELETLTREDSIHNQHITDLAHGIQKMQAERDDIAQRVA